MINRGTGLGVSMGATGTDVATTAGGLTTLLGGRGGTADGGATVCRSGTAGAAAEAVARGELGGWAPFWVIAFSTSPGLEMCDRSILGLNSSACARELRLVLLPGSPCSA